MKCAGELGCVLLEFDAGLDGLAALSFELPFPGAVRIVLGGEGGAGQEHGKESNQNA